MNKFGNEVVEMVVFVEVPVWGYLQKEPSSLWSGSYIDRYPEKGTCKKTKSSVNEDWMITIVGHTACIKAVVPFTHRTRWAERDRLLGIAREIERRLEAELFKVWYDHDPSEDEISEIAERYRKEVEIRI